ncbi:hypothetical protein XENORESO_019294 [Xenotaenia resolanae]|uniref:Uncharacterized protein n=1 Tax=Xenotaenia resolanae TaxID=208358 RepID=A0ABV0VZ49_9TELE
MEDVTLNFDVLIDPKNCLLVVCTTNAERTCICLFIKSMNIILQGSRLMNMNKSEHNDSSGACTGTQSVTLRELLCQVQVQQLSKHCTTDQLVHSEHRKVSGAWTIRNSM